MEIRPRWFDHLAINSYWLGLNIGSGILTPLLLPFLVVQFMPSEYKNTYLANLRVVGLAVAMLVQPLAGLLSDRSTSRFGRRRPFIFASALLSTLFLVVIGLSPTFQNSSLNAVVQSQFGFSAGYAVLMAGIVLLQFSANLGHGALQGLIPDLVPLNQRGRASGVKAVFELLPVFLVLFIGPLVDRGMIWSVVAIMMAGYLITMAITLLKVREIPQAKSTPGSDNPSSSLREPVLRLVALTVLFVSVTRAAIFLVQASAQLVTSLTDSTGLKIVLVGLAGLLAMSGSILLGVYFGAWVGIGKDAHLHKPFIWWVVNRLLFLAAVGSIQGFAQFFLRDALNIPQAATMTTLLLAVVAVFLIPSALFGGSLADRIGHRRLAALSGYIAAAGTLLLIVAANIAMVILAGCVIGLAAGAFLATNWALGTRLAPAREAGRYLGISNLAGAGAGIVGVGIGGPLADFFNQIRPGLGYMVLFAIYAGLFLLSSLTLGKTGQAVEAHEVISGL